MQVRMPVQLGTPTFCPTSMSDRMQLITMFANPCSICLCEAAKPYTSCKLENNVSDRHARIEFGWLRAGGLLAFTPRLPDLGNDSTP